MALNAGEQFSAGMVRDADGRQCVTVDGPSGVGTGNAGYPGSVAVPQAASSGNVAAAVATATLAASGGQTTYITGFEVTASGATAASVVLLTIANTKGGTMTYVFTAPAGVTTAATPLIVEFPYPIPANSVSTTIVVSLPSLGSGNTNAAVVAHGFIL
jgi:hypothetical protein